MKKVVLFFAFLFTATCCFAEGHLLFKGMEIDGNISQFTRKLEAQGFQKVYTTDEGDACMLKGNFAGFNECSVAILSTPNEHIVWKVAVYLPAQTSWYALETRYEEFKRSLEEKYGKPDFDSHYFNSPYYEGDGYELQALNSDKCNYMAGFGAGNGVVYIELDGAGYGKGEVRISYEDDANKALKNADKKNSMSSDL